MKRITLFKSMKLNSMVVLLALGLWSCDAGYNDWDANESGYIEQEEFEEGFAEVGYYEGWDVDNDNNLNEDEFYGGLFNTLDDNNNNLLDQEEWDTYQTLYSENLNREVGTFDEWDSDNDSYIDYDEFNDQTGDLFGFNDWDADNNDMLNEDEFNDGVFGLWDNDDDNRIGEEEFASWENTFGDNADEVGTSETNE